MHATTFSVLLLLMVSQSSLAGEDCPLEKPWRCCRKDMTPLVDTVKNVISGMCTDKKMHVCGESIKPCERLTMINIESIDFAEPGTDEPGSCPCKEGATDCFSQHCPLKLTEWKISCEFDDELSFMKNMALFMGEAFTAPFCKQCPDSMKSICLAGKGADVVKTGLGKRDIHVVKRGAEDTPCADQKKNFAISVSSTRSDITIDMTLDWETEKHSVDKCSFKQEDFKSMKVEMDGDTEGIKYLYKVLTADPSPLPTFMGMIVQQIADYGIGQYIQNDNGTIKENICALNCGD